MSEDARAESAFMFRGTWREYAPIAFTNLLLTIVTLGIYRFWAKTRERRYLWSRTDFIGDPLEWTGTGKELFIGFLLVLVLLVPPLFILQFGGQALMLRGYIFTAFLSIFAAYAAFLYLMGVARFRAIRYRLSRSLWHGIRGGSNVRGWDYGLSAVWKTVVGSLPIGLAIPWSMTSLWNERWNQMSFGNHRFRADASAEKLIGRFLLFYLFPVVGCVAGASMVATMGAPPSAVFVVLGILAGYACMGIIAIVYYAAFLREAIGELTLHDVGFAFTARTTDWIKLLLGHAALLIVTLGLGFVFLGYRNWSFFIRHMEATGEVTLSELAQSSADEPTQGEGLLDAFDVGAF